MSRTVQLTIDTGKQINVKPYRWITTEEQKDFHNFLDSSSSIDKEKLDKIKDCSNEFWTYDCTYDVTHPQKIKYNSCGQRGVCPRCSMSYAHVRGSAMYRQLRNFANQMPFDLKLNQLVLTLPKSLHTSLDTKTFRKMLHEFVSKFGIEAYGYSLQYRHSKDPLSDRYLHAHILTLNIKEHYGKLAESNYFFDVNLMRSVWKDTIQKYTDCIIDGDVDLHTEYHSIINQANKTKHILSYLYRYSIQDLFNVQTRNKSIDYHQSILNYVQKSQFENSSGSNSISLQIDSLIKEPKSLTWCGLLTSAKRKYLLEFLIPNTIGELGTWKTLKEILHDLKEESKKCRECGNPFSEVWIDRGKYDGDNEPDDFYKSTIETSVN